MHLQMRASINEDGYTIIEESVESPFVWSPAHTDGISGTVDNAVRSSAPSLHGRYTGRRRYHRGHRAAEVPGAEKKEAQSTGLSEDFFPVGEAKGLWTLGGLAEEPSLSFPMTAGTTYLSAFDVWREENPLQEDGDEQTGHEEAWGSLDESTKQKYQELAFNRMLVQRTALALKALPLSATMPEPDTANDQGAERKADCFSFLPAPSTFGDCASFGGELVSDVWNKLNNKKEDDKPTLTPLPPINRFYATVVSSNRDVPVIHLDDLQRDTAITTEWSPALIPPPTDMLTQCPVSVIHIILRYISRFKHRELISFLMSSKTIFAKSLKRGGLPSLRPQLCLLHRARQAKLDPFKKMVAVVGKEGMTFFGCPRRALFDSSPKGPSNVNPELMTMLAFEVLRHGRTLELLDLLMFICDSLDVRLMRDSKETLPHIACRRGLRDVCLWLHTKGASFETADGVSGRTPLEFCYQSGNMQLWLELWGALHKDETFLGQPANMLQGTVQGKLLFEHCGNVEGAELEMKLLPLLEPMELERCMVMKKITRREAVHLLLAIKNGETSLPDSSLK